MLELRKQEQVGIVLTIIERVCLCGRSVLYLGGEVVLLQLPSLSQVPGPHGVIQASSPQLGPVIRDIYTAGSVGVALKLPAERHRVRKPYTEQQSVHQVKEHTYCMYLHLVLEREDGLKIAKGKNVLRSAINSTIKVSTQCQIEGT